MLKSPDTKSNYGEQLLKVAGNTAEFMDMPFKYLGEKTFNATEGLPPEVRGLLSAAAYTLPQFLSLGGLLGGTRTGRGLLNATRTPMNRRFTKAIFPTETAVTNPKTLLNVDLNDATGISKSMNRLEGAVKEAGGPYSKGSFSKGQGVWPDEVTGQMQYNPVFMQKMKVGDNLSNNDEALRYMAQVSENLKQEGNSIVRFNPHYFNDLDKGDSLLLNNVSNESIKKLGDKLGKKLVISARPGNKAFISSFDGGMNAKGLLADVKTVIKKPKYKTGISKPGQDRIYANPSGEWADFSYSELGAVPRSENLNFLDILRFQQGN